MLGEAVDEEKAQLSAADWPFGALLLIALGTWVWAIRRARRGQPPLAYQGRRPVPWRGTDVAAIFLTLAAFVVLCPGVLLHLYHARPTDAGRIPVEMQPVVFAGQSVCELCVMLLVIGLLIRKRGADWTDLGIDPRQVRRDLGIGLIGFLFIDAPVDLFYTVLQLIKPGEPHPLIELAIRQPSQLWLIGFCAVLVAPLVEEFFFRVVLQGWLERRQRSVPREDRLLPMLPTGVLPIVVSSFLFAAMHGDQWPAPVPLFFLALVLGYLYHQTHRLLPSLVVHALLNGSTFLSLWWMVHSGALPGK